MCHKVWLDVPTLCEFSFRSLGFLSKFSNTFMCFFCYLLPLFVIPLPALPVFVTLAGVPSFYTTNNSIQSGLCFFFFRKSILNIFVKRQRMKIIAIFKYILMGASHFKVNVSNEPAEAWVFYIIILCSFTDPFNSDRGLLEFPGLLEFHRIV